MINRGVVLWGVRVSVPSILYPVDISVCKPTSCYHDSRGNTQETGRLCAGPPVLVSVSGGLQELCLWIILDKNVGETMREETVLLHVPLYSGRY